MFSVDKSAAGCDVEQHQKISAGVRCTPSDVLHTTSTPPWGEEGRHQSTAASHVGVEHRRGAL